MATKITQEGNYFIVEDTTVGVTNQSAKANTEYRVDDQSGNGTYQFFNTETRSYLNKEGPVAFSDIIDSGDAAFASKAALLTFLRANTGI